MAKGRAKLSLSTRVGASFFGLLSAVTFQNSKLYFIYDYCNAKVAIEVLGKGQMERGRVSSSFVAMLRFAFFGTRIQIKLASDVNPFWLRVNEREWIMGHGPLVHCIEIELSFGIQIL